ncbi:MAG: ABC transporter permease [Desulfobacterales bacterium]|jgi:ABC-type dipeptide/oligopeptide/nickel transport system permease subunit|nr:ABC transporter permease [Desulfobacterales bacterium]
MMGYSDFKVLRALARHKIALAGIIILLCLLTMSVFAPFLAPHDPNEQDLYHVLEGPSRQHLLGTDDVGRDLLSRVIYGSRVTLLIGGLSALFAAVIGVLLGLVAGYKGGITDMIIMRLTDTVMSMPQLILVLVAVAAIGPGMKNLIIVISALTWPGYARIVRGESMRVRELPYIEAAHAVGASGFRIMFRHILPNIMAPIIVTASISVGANIMMESTVSFLGLGVQPPTPTWGNELKIGYSYLEVVPLFSIAPGMMVTLAVLAFNFIGDGIRDIFDPRF